MCITTNACAYNIFSFLILFCVRVGRPLAVRVQNLFFRMSLFEMATGKKTKAQISQEKQLRYGSIPVLYAVHHRIVGKLTGYKDS